MERKVNGDRKRGGSGEGKKKEESFGGRRRGRAAWLMVKGTAREGAQGLKLGGLVFLLSSFSRRFFFSSPVHFAQDDVDAAEDDHGVGDRLAETHVFEDG